MLASAAYEAVPSNFGDVGIGEDEGTSLFDDYDDPNKRNEEDGEGDGRPSLRNFSSSSTPRMGGERRGGVGAAWRSWRLGSPAHPTSTTISHGPSSSNNNNNSDDRSGPINNGLNLFANLRERAAQHRKEREERRLFQIRNSDMSWTRNAQQGSKGSTGVSAAGGAAAGTGPGDTILDRILVNVAGGTTFGPSDDLDTLILREDWNLASISCQSRPHQAKRWTVRTDFFMGRHGSRVLPLHSAAALRPPESMIQTLVMAHPAGVKEVESAFGRLPLHCACRANASVDVVRALLAYHPDGAMARDKLDRVPLHYALKNGSDETVVDALLEFHPECVKVSDHRGWLPVHVACCSGSEVEILKKLLDMYQEGRVAKTNRGSTLMACAKMCVKKDMMDNIIHFLQQDEQQHFGPKTASDEPHDVDHDDHDNNHAHAADHNDDAHNSDDEHQDDEHQDDEHQDDDTKDDDHHHDTADLLGIVEDTDENKTEQDKNVTVTAVDTDDNALFHADFESATVSTPIGNKTSAQDDILNDFVASPSNIDDILIQPNEEEKQNKAHNRPLTLTHDQQHTTVISPPELTMPLSPPPPPPPSLSSL